MNNAEIKILVDDYVSLDEEIKRLEKKRDRMKEQVIALGEGDHRSNLGKVAVTLSQRTLLDQKALKEALGEQLAPYYKTSSSITVRVTKFEGDEE
jgi:hypothetical protein